jgi:hypothetical protein
MEHKVNKRRVERLWQQQDQKWSSSWKQDDSLYPNVINWSCSAARRLALCLCLLFLILGAPQCNAQGITFEHRYAHSHVVCLWLQDRCVNCVGYLRWITNVRLVWEVVWQKLNVAHNNCRRYSRDDRNPHISLCKRNHHRLSILPLPQYKEPGDSHLQRCISTPQSTPNPTPRSRKPLQELIYWLTGSEAA